VSTWAALAMDDARPLSLDKTWHESFRPGQVKIEAVQPVDKLAPFGGRCLALRNVLSSEECAYLIKEMSAQGCLEAVAYRSDYRKNDRCVFFAQELADLLWRIEAVTETFAVEVEADPARQHLLGEAPGECPPELRIGHGHEGLWEPVGLNECMRFCRYDPGGFFRSHCDGRFQSSDDEMSLFTCMSYLDGDMDGGATRFLNINMELNQQNYLKPAQESDVLASVQPEAGLCLLFFQPGLLHEGEELRAGVKHILRTEVMFRRKVGTAPERSEREKTALALAKEAQAISDTEPSRACELFRRAFKLDPKLEQCF